MPACSLTIAVSFRRYLFLLSRSTEGDRYAYAYGLENRAFPILANSNAPGWFNKVRMRLSYSSSKIDKFWPVYITKTAYYLQHDPTIPALVNLDKWNSRAHRNELIELANALLNTRLRKHRTIGAGKANNSYETEASAMVTVRLCTSSII